MRIVSYVFKVYRTTIYFKQPSHQLFDLNVAAYVLGRQALWGFAESGEPFDRYPSLQ